MINWTPEMDAALIRMRDEGCSRKEVAAALGVGETTAWNRAEHLRLEPYNPSIKWTPEMDAELLRLRSAGCGYNAAAVAIGVSPDTVRRRVRKLKLPTWGRGGAFPRVVWTKKMDDRLKSLRDDGLSFIDTAKLLGVGKDAVTKRVVELGLPRVIKPSRRM